MHRGQPLSFARFTPSQSRLACESSLPSLSPISVNSNDTERRGEDDETQSAHSETNAHKLGVTLGRLRHESRLTQEELAHLAGLHRSYLADVERGARNPSFIIVAVLLHALGRELFVLRRASRRYQRLL